MGALWGGPAGRLLDRRDLGLRELLGVPVTYTSNYPPVREPTKDAAASRTERAIAARNWIDEGSLGGPIISGILSISMVSVRRAMSIPREKVELYASRFRCLGHPTRLMILRALAVEGRPLSVREIVDRVDVGQSTVSVHLRRLAETCFVLVEHRGTSSLFWLNQRCIDEFPAAAEFVMAGVAGDRLSSPRPGVTSRRPQRRRLPNDEACAQPDK